MHIKDTYVRIFLLRIGNKNLKGLYGTVPVPYRCHKQNRYLPLPLVPYRTINNCIFYSTVPGKVPYLGQSLDGSGTVLSRENFFSKNNYGRKK